MKGCCQKAIFWWPKTNEGDRFLDMVTMCDENTLWQFESKTKQQSSQWTEIRGLNKKNVEFVNKNKSTSVVAIKLLHV